MRLSQLASFTAGIFFALNALASAPSPLDYPSVKHSVNLPPSADLFYTARAEVSGFSVTGNALVEWTASGKQFGVHAEASIGALGKLLDTRSEGMVNAYGLAPMKLIEKRFRKPPHTVTFDHKDKTISFSSSTQTYPLKGGEQDRTSIAWQIIAIARGAPNKVNPGTEWPFFVAGRKNAEIWTFRVIGPETVKSPLGDIAAIHIATLPSTSRKEQQLDLWLAPSLDWYPIRMVFKDIKGIDMDQVIQRIEKRSDHRAASLRSVP